MDHVGHLIIFLYELPTFHVSAINYAIDFLIFFPLFFIQVPSGSDGKESACNAVSLGREDHLQKGMAIYSSIHAWRIPRTKEPGGLVHGVAKSETRLHFTS